VVLKVDLAVDLHPVLSDPRNGAYKAALGNTRQEAYSATIEILATRKSKIVNISKFRECPRIKLKRRQVIDLAALSGCGDRI
jgi:hypothetical protein